MLPIIQKRGIFYAISGTLFVAAVLLWIAWGLKLGIDFTGGSLMEVTYSASRPAIADVRAALDPLKVENLNIQTAGDTGYLLRFKEVSEETHQKILTALRDELAPKTAPAATKPAAAASEKGATVAQDTTNTVTEKRFSTIGPSIGQELRTRAIYSLILVVLGIIIYIAWSFRKVSYPIESWKYGVAANVALLHDLMITVGIFVVLGRYFNVEVNTPFVAAMLTILGYSVNDTIVVFDRIRENLHRYEGAFEDIVNKSVNETMVRSINTSSTVMLVLFAIFFFGGDTIRDFTIALLFGVFFGTYSSIFIASALLVDWHKFMTRLQGE